MNTLGKSCVIAVASLTAFPAFAQFWNERNRRFPDPPVVSQFPGGKFTFCTIRYRNNGWDEPLGFGWSTDWPDAGYYFMIRLAELTTIEINRDENGEPRQEILTLTDPALFNYPIVWMSDAGTCGLLQDEVDALRRYLLAGGLLHVDDFWGETAWKNWVYEISRVLPPDEYPIVDVPLSHDIFHIVFEVKELPQVPSIQYWSSTRDGTTSERGAETAEPHFRGIFDKHGRLMVLMTHNTDIADGWEKEGESQEYFREFSVKKSYPVGINLVVYALTH